MMKKHIWQDGWFSLMGGQKSIWWFEKNFLGEDNYTCRVDIDVINGAWTRGGTHGGWYRQAIDERISPYFKELILKNIKDALDNYSIRFILFIPDNIVEKGNLTGDIEVKSVFQISNLLKRMLDQHPCVKSCSLELFEHGVLMVAPLNNLNVENRKYIKETHLSSRFALRLSLVLFIISLFVSIIGGLI